MKRAVEADNRVQSQLKRPRSAASDRCVQGSPDLALFDQQRRVEDVFKDGTDGFGCIKVKVKMKWPPFSGNFRISVASLDEASSQKYDVIFSGSAAKCKELVALSIEDEILLALKGAEIENSQSPKLHYKQGASVKFIKSRNTNRIGQIVNAWTRAAPAGSDAPVADDWFATPAPSTSHNLGRTAELTREDPKASTGSLATSATQGYSPADSVVLVPAVHQVARTPGSFHLTKPIEDPSSVITCPGDERPSTMSGERKSTPDHQRVTSDVPHGVGPILPIYVSSSAVVSGENVRTKGREVNMNPVSGPRPQSPTKEAPASVQNTDSDISAGPGPCVGIRMDSSKVTAPQSKKHAKNWARRLKKLKRAAEMELESGQASSSTSRLSSTSDGQEDGQQDRHAMSTISAQMPSSLHATEHPVRDSSQRPAADPAMATTKGIVPPDDSTMADFSTMIPPSGRRPETNLPSAFVAGSARSSSQKPALLPKHEAISAPHLSQPVVPQSYPSRHQSLSHTIVVKSEGLNPVQCLQDDSPIEDSNYKLLSTVKEVGKIYDIIGIVTSDVVTCRTSSGEFKIGLFLTDPSIHGSSNFEIACFSKTETPLSQTKKDHILLLRYAQWSDWQGRVSASCPSYKAWRWATYDPNTNNKAEEPDSSCASQNSRRFRLSPQELRYCMDLAKWWKSVNDDADVHQIIGRPGLGRRIHRLIADTSPEVEPNGYFDCTVEVLAGFENNDGVYTLYVTDYTRNSSMLPIERDLWPRQLDDKVLKLELFDAAAAKGPAIAERKGYYFIGNCRMKVGGDGNLEATFSEIQKMRELDADELEHEPQLVELLERKGKFAAQVDLGADEFPHKRFDEVEVDRIFCCTVEVLSISRNGERTFLYVTDYTSRMDLAPVNPADRNFDGLENRVVKIALFDGQVATGNQLEPGDIISIRNLRLRAVGGTKSVSGRLGGERRLISKLQSKGSNNPERKSLLMHKEKWQTHWNSRRNNTAQSVRSLRGAKDGTYTDKQSVHNVTSSELAPAVTSAADAPALPMVASASQSPLKLSTIKDVEASDKCPNKFLIKARIVDFFPEKVADFTVRRCTNCGDDISDSMRVCPGCDDAMDPDNHTYVRTFWQFWFEVADEEGPLRLAVCDDQCPLLKDFDPADVDERDDSLTEFTERLKPLVGDLMEVCGGVAQRRLDQLREQTDTDTPTLWLTVGSWSTGDGNARGYVLMDHAAVTG